jgi:hypothetical protein
MRSLMQLNVRKDEDGVWSWWTVISSFLSICIVYLSQIQLVVVAEMNHKWRRLERESVRQSNDNQVHVFLLVHL